MERSGWEPVPEQMVGGVALWGFREDVPPEGREFGHTGLYVGNATFISHSCYARVPVEHPEHLQDGRLPLAFYGHAALISAQVTS